MTLKEKIYSLGRMWFSDQDREIMARVVILEALLACIEQRNNCFENRADDKIKKMDDELLEILNIDDGEYNSSANYKI